MSQAAIAQPSLAVPSPDLDEMRRTLSVLFDPDDVIELRAIAQRGRKRVDAGYFDGSHREALIREAVRLNKAGASIYATLNRLDPQLLSRYANRTEEFAQATATDANITRRRWLLLDFDPVRPKDTSSTAEQLADARTAASACRNALRDDGWPDPVPAQSGNGFHLLYPVDLPNDTESNELVKGALGALASCFDTDKVKLDRSVFNAARITKLYGSVANKGDHTPLAPWRVSKLVGRQIPERKAVVTVDQLRAVVVQPVRAPAPRCVSSGQSFDIEGFLARSGIGYLKDYHNRADRYRLEHCPFNPEHGRGEAAVLQYATGALSFNCKHNSCSDKRWQDFRELVDGPKEQRAAQTPGWVGESGERGEPSLQSTISAGRTAGESGRILSVRSRPKLSDSEIEAALQRAGKELAKKSGIDSTKEFMPSPYPVAALGPLAGPCKAIAEDGQIAPDMAGQCLLSTAALLTQSQANVRTLAGIKPLSIFSITIGDSGDGKSTADDAALKRVRDWQRETSKVYREEVESVERSAAGRKKGDPKPEAPREPYLIMRDGTVEGIRRAFRQGLPSQGVFTSEAAAMIAGYGMNPDNRLKSAGNFNALWDDGEISVARGLDGRLQLYDRRLSLHWLIQPDVARSALHDPLLSSIGFWPRFLLSWTPPAPPRAARAFHPETSGAIAAYWERCAELLRNPLGEDCGGLQVIAADSEAMALAGAFFERMEKQAKTSGGALEGVKPFAVRATEHMFRIAGVLACFDGAKEIDAEALRNAMALAVHSIQAWRAVYGDRDEAEGRALALALYGWMLRQPGGEATETAILRIATPKNLRSRSRRDTALALLEQAGLVERERATWIAITEGGK